MIGGKIFNRSAGGCTTKILLSDLLPDILAADAEVFVIAIGANDIRYRDERICSMTATEYVATLERLRAEIAARRPGAKFIFIAPWTSTDGDFISRLPFEQKRAAVEAYSAALKNWCDGQGDWFIDANAYIEARLKIRPRAEFLIDFIHPNAGAGVRLYSEAVLNFGGDVAP